jgi:hypothetical protein
MSQILTLQRRNNNCNSSGGQKAGGAEEEGEGEEEGGGEEHQEEEEGKCPTYIFCFLFLQKGTGITWKTFLLTLCDGIVFPFT